MDIKKIIVGLTVVLISLSIFADHHRGGMKSMAAIAESWVKAQYTSKEKTLAVVKNHMAEDGVSFSGRFVGFGFNWDPENEEGMIVTRVGFDESGKVNFIGALSEDELLLRQTGWSITR